MNKNNTTNDCSSFFDDNYQTPEFISKKKTQGRRNFLKSAAGMGSLATLASFTPLSSYAKEQASLNSKIKSDPWLTLDATLNQLLPSSDSGPSARDIKATNYLYQVMTTQPTEQEEKDFILKGVGWLNGYANTEKSANFVQLDDADKEKLLQGISQSRAGRNWLNTLLSYIFQAMLAPESYGGNPKGVGWQWLEHQPGFPLPERGQRYYELPARAKINLISHVEYNNKVITAPKKNHQGTRKA